MSITATVSLVLGLMSTNTPQELQPMVLDDSLKEHSTKVVVRELDHPDAFIYRRIFTLALMGKSNGLSDDDVAQISAWDRTGVGRAALEPYLVEIENALADGSSAVHIAGIWQEAVETEQSDLAEHYREILSTLSADGQSLVNQLKEAQLENPAGSKIDYVSVAADEPDGFIQLMNAAVADFRNPESGSGKASQKGNSGKSGSSPTNTGTGDEL